MKRGRQLLRDIAAATAPLGSLTFWWLGQHGFVIKVGRTTLFLDPFLSHLPGRLIKPLLAPGQITCADVVLGSHDHADHIDRPAWPLLAAASPAARFIIPEAVRNTVLQTTGLPPTRVIGLDDGETHRLGNLRITGIAAAHEFLDRDPLSGRHPYLGYVIEANGCTIYHSGDTCIHEGLLTRLREWSFDLVFLPINGRDARRLAAGCIGNMTYQEAADLAGTLRPRLVVPGHYDMFASNLGDALAFADYVKVKYPGLPVAICRHGEAVHLPPPDRRPRARRLSPLPKSRRGLSTK